MKLRLQELLQLCIDLKPRAIWLSFGDVKPLAKSIKAAGIKVVVQVQYLDDVEAALEAGADVIVGQVTTHKLLHPLLHAGLCYLAAESRRQCLVHMKWHCTGCCA